MQRANVYKQGGAIILINSNNFIMQKESLVISGIRSRSLSPIAIKQLQQAIIHNSSPCSKPKLSCEDQPQKLEKLHELKEIVHEQDYAQKIRQQREKVEVLKLEFEKKQEELIDKNNQISKLLRQRQQLRKQKEAYDRLLVDYDRLLYQNQRLLQQKKLYQNQFHSLSEERLDDVVNELREQLCIVKNDLQIAKVTNSQLEKTVAMLKCQNQDHQDNFNYNLKLLKIRIDTLTQELDKANSQNSQYRDKLDNSGNGRSLLQDQIKDLKSVLARLKDQNELLSNDLNVRQEIILCLKQKMGNNEVNYHRELAEMVTQLERRTIQLRKRDAQLNDLKLKLEQRDSKITLTQKDLISANDEKDRLTRQLKKLQVELEHNRSNSDSGQGIISQLKKQIQARDVRLARLKQCKQHDRQVRLDIGNLRHQTRLAKFEQIDRMDQIINQMGLKYAKKRFQ